MLIINHVPVNSELFVFLWKAFPSVHSVKIPIIPFSENFLPVTGFTLNLSVTCDKNWSLQVFRDCFSCGFVYLFWAWLNPNTDEIGMVCFPVAAPIPWILPRPTDFTLVECFIEERTDKCAFLKESARIIDYCTHPYVK